jgi:hypothetical protein
MQRISTSISFIFNNQQFQQTILGIKSETTKTEFNLTEAKIELID